MDIKQSPLVFEEWTTEFYGVMRFCALILCNFQTFLTWLRCSIHFPWNSLLPIYKHKQPLKSNKRFSFHNENNNKLTEKKMLKI